MYSTAYIIGSVLVFFLDILPSSKLNESTTLQIVRFDKRDKRYKVQNVLNKIILVCGKINLGVCALLLLLKCVGVIPWW